MKGEELTFLTDRLKEIENQSKDMIHEVSELLFDHVDSSVIILQNNIIVYHNKKLLEIFNRKEIHLTGRSINDILPDFRFENFDISNKNIKINREGRPAIKQDVRFDKILWNGETCDVLFLSDPGEADITNELENLKLLINHSASLNYIVQGNKYVFANKRFLDVYEYSMEELGEIDFWDIVHPDHRLAVKERGQNRLKGEEEPRRYEIKTVSKSGKVYWIDYIGTRVIYKGEPAVIGTGIDITERKRARVELEESENRFHLFLKNSLDGIFLTDEHGRIVEWNAMAEQLFGIKREKVIGEFIWDVQYSIANDFEGKDQFFKKLEEDFLKFYKTGDYSFLGKKIENTVQTSKGKRTVQTIVFSIPTAKGFQLGGTSRDVSEVVEVQKNLNESNARLAEAQKLAHVGNYDCETPFGTCFWSEETYNIHGVKREMPVPVGQDYMKLIHPEDRVKYLELENKAFEKNKKFNLIYRIKRSGGAIRYVHNTGVPTVPVSTRKAKKGKEVRRMVGTIHDITERMNSVKALEKSESIYRILVNSLDNYYIFMLNASLDVEFINNKAVDLIDQASYPSVLGKKVFELFPEITGCLRDKLQSVLKNGRKQNCDCPLIDSISHKQFDSLIIPIMDNRKVAKIIYLSRDVTEEKQKELLIKENEIKFRAVFDTIPVGVYLSDFNGKLMDVNKMGVKNFNKAKEELMGRGIVDLFFDGNESSLKSLVNNLSKVKFIQEEKDIEFSGNGARRTFLVVYRRIELVDRQMFYLVTFNLSERKAFERALNQKHSLFAENDHEMNIIELLDWSLEKLHDAGKLKDNTICQQKLARFGMFVRQVQENFKIPR